jgi:ABC-2 type transport system permease protein
VTAAATVVAGPGPVVTGWGGYRPVPRLLGARARMAVNACLHAGPEQRGRTLILGTLALAWWLGAHHLAGDLLGAGAPSPATLESSLAAALATLCGVVAVTSVSFAISGLYFARDIEMLLVAPLAPRAVLLAKLCVQLVTGVGMAALLAGPWLVAYLSAEGALAALPVVALAAVALAALPLAAGTAATIATVRVMPARRVRDAAALLVTGTVFTVTALSVVLRSPDGTHSTPLGLDAPGRGRLADLAWLPTGWASRAVVAAVRGELATAALLTLLLTAAGAAALLLVSRLGEVAFVAGRQRSAEAGAGGRRRRAGARLRPGGDGGPRAVWLSIARKDLRELRRDASQLGQLVLPVGLFALYIAVPGQAPTAAAATARLPAWFSVALTAGFASLFAASGVALRGVGAEGSRLWLLRTAPVRTGQVLLAKFAVGLAVAAGLGLGLLVIGGLREHLTAAAIGLAGVRLLVIVAGLVALATGLGAVRPRLDWTDPRRSVGIGQSLGFLALGSGYLALCFTVLALPYAHVSPGDGALTAGDAGVVAVAAGTAWLALRIGIARLRSIEL